MDAESEGLVQRATVRLRGALEHHHSLTHVGDLV